MKTRRFTNDIAPPWLKSRLCNLLRVCFTELTFCLLLKAIHSAYWHVRCLMQMMDVPADEIQ